MLLLPRLDAVNQKCAPGSGNHNNIRLTALNYVGEGGGGNDDMAGDGGHPSSVWCWSSCVYSLPSPTTLIHPTKAINVCVVWSVLIGSHHMNMNTNPGSKI